MRETTLSLCEKNFILNAASEYKRLDGRKLDEFRDFNVYFGNDWGLCYVTLGQTRIITQVSCEVQQPKTTRPNEGLLFINVEVKSMAAPYIEPGRGSDISNHLNRLLEKCIKDSKAVDLESLCLVAEEKVWALRVDVNILNHDGNLIQAASMSAIAALAHFKRPDVTTNGEEIIVHDITERDPISVTLHHFPVCITFALLNNGENVIADPTAIEERISDTSLTFGVNTYGEICGLHLGGNALVEPSLILKYSKKASVKAKEFVGIIKETLNKDSLERQSKEFCGLVQSIHWDKVKYMSDGRLMIQLSKFSQNSTGKLKDAGDIQQSEGNVPSTEIIDLGDNSAELIPIQKNIPSSSHLSERCNKELEEEPPKNIFFSKKVDIVHSVEEDILSRRNYGEGGPSKWEVVDFKNQDMEDSDSCKSDEVHVLDVAPKMDENIELSGDSEEEVLILEPQDIGNPTLVSNQIQNKPKSNYLTGSRRTDGTKELRGDEMKYSKKKRQRMLKKK